MSGDRDRLAARAADLGVETSYWDVEGRLHHASSATLAAIVDVLDADAVGGPTQVAPVVLAGHGPIAIGRLDGLELELAGGGTISIGAHGGRAELPADLPIGCHRLRGADGDDTEEATVVVAPARMPRDRRFDQPSTGVFVPAYALWERDEPAPSYRHLQRLAGRLAERGIDVLSTLPLYATFLDEPFDPSPYSPISRLHWNETYVALDRDEACEGPLDRLVDWAELAPRRRRQLLAAAADLDAETAAELARFVAARPDVDAFAEFQTARRSPLDDQAPAATVRRSYQLGQLLADRALAAIEGDTSSVLALDLPIGSHPLGFEPHAHPDLFATTMSVGAPPDDFFADGQNWGFAPTLPAAGRRRGHDLWRRVVERAGEHASLLRIDHVMGVQRLWWIPDGHDAADGAYVRYPREELLAVVAVAAVTAGTTIVGEDLGTVSDEVREALDRWGVIGLYEEQFHLDRSPLPRPGRDRVAGLRTHDMRPFAAEVAEAPDRLAAYRNRVAAELGRPVDDDHLVDAALERLCQTDATVVLADLDDLLDEVTPHNIPGRVLPTNWRRRLPEPTSAVLADATVDRRLAILGRRRRANGPTDRSSATGDDA